MSVVQVIDNKAKVQLSENYDVAYRCRLWDELVAGYRRWVNNPAIINKGRESFKIHLEDKVADFLCTAEFVDKDGNNVPLEIPLEIPSETIRNFLSKSEVDLPKVAFKTFRFVEIFVIAIRGKQAGYNRKSLIATLGASTALQYTSTSHPTFSTLRRVSLENGGLYSFEALTSQIPSPLQAKLALLWFRQVPEEDFLYVGVLPLPQEIEFSRLSAGDLDKSDWSEEQYRGIGIATKDGISCHLTSLNAQIPLYIFVRVTEKDQFETAFISYNIPGYLNEYYVIEELNSNEIRNYFVNTFGIL